MAIALTTLGIACILYGLIVLAAASGTWFFAFWFVLGAALLGSAWFVYSGNWAALPRAGRLAIEIALGLLLIGFLATQILIARDFSDKGEPSLDYLIVLGAQVRNDGPSLVLRYRLDKAFDYLTNNPNTLCIVSGGKSPSEPISEAEGMAEYLISRGIDPSRIIRESKSTSTDENISYSKELLDPAVDRVGIVTNNFHVYRGVNIARKAGFANVCGIAAPSSPLFLPNNLVRESLGIAQDFATGYL